MSLRALVATLLLAVLSGGCAAVALPVLGAAALSGGASGAAQAGTEFTLSGAAAHTFMAPLPDVRVAVLTALDRMQVDLGDDDTTKNGARIRARAGKRHITVKLERLTPNLTRMQLSVRHLVRHDTATATEIIAQTENVLADLVPGAIAGVPASPAASPRERR